MLKTFPDQNFKEETLEELAYNSSIAIEAGDNTTIITGPFFIEIDGIMECCFTSNNGFGSNGLRKTKKKKGSVLKDSISLQFVHQSLLAEFFFKPEANPYGTLYVHSPLRSFRKGDKSLIVKGWKGYDVAIRLGMKRLLEHPYESDCRDYELSWKKNNNTGPVSREC
ncbi:hypothetical protein JTE90_009163 [Oedothorax gibbosus]|uniref:Uncharacterized protein n=1 Tax=Oedothorax gibbosus TaxID=931172 RepID=A0AAV6TSX5_9ARAC|nr:hypothetical protein JTE90_009163 [Oedothorax gibbosus]